MQQSGHPWKILVISDYRPFLSARPEAEIFIRLAQLGHEVHIFSYPEASRYNDRFRSHNITVIEEHPRKKISWAFIRRLRRYVAENGIDFVHAFNSKGLSNAVWALQGLSAKLLAYRGYAGNTVWYDPTMYLKYFHPRVDRIICLTEEMREIFQRQMPWAKYKAIVIPKGHDPEWYADVIPIERKVLGFSETDVLICMVANLRPFKGLTYLLKAIHTLRLQENVHFIFIGQGYDQPDVQAAIRENQYKDHIHLLGYQADVLAILAACDGLVLPSSHGEGLNKSVIEALSLKKPVIVTDIPGNSMLVKDGDGGWVVPPANASVLANALQECIDHPEERKARGIRGQKFIAENLHLQQTVDAFLDLYRSLKPA